MIFYSIGHYSVECLTITSTRKIWDKTNQHIHNFVKFLITSKANLSIKFPYPFRGGKNLVNATMNTEKSMLHDLNSWSSQLRPGQADLITNLDEPWEEFDDTPISKPAIQPQSCQNFRPWFSCLYLLHASSVYEEHQCQHPGLVDQTKLGLVP